MRQESDNARYIILTKYLLGILSDCAAIDFLKKLSSQQ